MEKLILHYENKPSNYYSNARSEMLEFIPKGANKILEVGCGAGVFGSMLKTERNAEVWGIDICHSTAEEARRKLDKIIIGDIENDDLDLPSNYFDCIVFNDSLEHLKYPWITLKKLRDNLAISGCVVASIPNVRYYYHVYDLLIYKKWEYTNAGILDNTHLRFFTKKSIEDMFEACSYHVDRIDGIRPCRVSWKYQLLNFILHGDLNDMRYLQFICIARRG